MVVLLAICAALATGYLANWLATRQDMDDDGRRALVVLAAIIVFVLIVSV